MMKKMSLLLSMLAVISLNAADTKTTDATQTNLDRVYVDVNQIFQQSSAGQEVARWSEAKNKQLNTLLSTKQADLRAFEQEIMSGTVAPEAVQTKTAQLELKKREASLAIESTKLEMESELGQKMRSVEQDIRSTIKTVANEKNWNEVVNKDEAKTLFFSDKLDATKTILEAFNKSTRADAAKAMLRADSSKAPEFLKA